MALRSRLQSIRPTHVNPGPGLDNAQQEMSTGADHETDVVVTRGGVREPAEPSYAPSEPGAPESEAPESEAPVAKTRKPRGPNKIKPEKRIAGGVMASPALTPTDVRAQIKALEADLKVLRSKHEDEIKALRAQHRALHDQLFDLTK